jgi:3-oxoacyl-[acyl-carrier-protein] synthase I
VNQRQELLLENFSVVSAVGDDAQSTYAALRAGINNNYETDFFDQDWNPIVAARAAIDPSIFGESRLRELAKRAIDLIGLRDIVLLKQTPILLCVADEKRIGRPVNNLQLLERIMQHFSLTVHPDSCVIPMGRTGGLVALENARKLIYEKKHIKVLIVATDSLIDADLLTHLDRTGQLLTPENSNGFIPGEAGCACLVRQPTPADDGLVLLGLGFTVTDPNAVRPAGKNQLPIDGQELGLAIQLAMNNAQIDAENVSVRIADISGSDASFAESAMAEPIAFADPDIPFPALWIPSQSLGEVGAPWATIACGWLEHSAMRYYHPGGASLVHATNDTGLRGAALFEFRKAIELRS